MIHNNLDEAVKKELENIEAPYSADDWEKVASILSNEKSSKGLLSKKVSFSVKPERIPSFKMPKITTSFKVGVGVVIVIGIIVTLFTLFDYPSSKEQNTHETKIESPREDDMVKGADTTTQPAVISDSVTSTVEGSAEKLTATEPENTERNADGTLKKIEPKPTGERKIRKAKMEIEEIGDTEATTPKASISVTKRKRSKDSTSSPMDNDNTLNNDLLPPPTVIEEPEITTPSTEETAPDSEEDAKKENRKKKRQKLGPDEGDGPKSFRELDSIK